MRIHETETEGRGQHRPSPNRRSALLFTVAGMFGAVAQMRRARAESRAPDVHGTASVPRRNGTKAAADRYAISAAGLPDLKAAGPQSQVRAIHQRAGVFEITTADGQARLFKETDLRLKIDTSDKGPAPGQPVVLSSGRMGDRATVFFASPAEVGLLIKNRG